MFFNFVWAMVVQPADNEFALAPYSELATCLRVVYTYFDLVIIR